MRREVPPPCRCRRRERGAWKGGTAARDDARGGQREREQESNTRRRHVINPDKTVMRSSPAWVWYPDTSGFRNTCSGFPTGDRVVSFRFVSYLTLSTEHKAYKLHDPSVL